MDLRECIKQLDERIEIMIDKKDKYLSKRLYALIMPILLFLLGRMFTSIGIGYLVGISLGYGVVSSVCNYIRYQYCRGIILSDNMKKLEIEMLDNADNLNEFFYSVKKRQDDVKQSIIGYSETLQSEFIVLVLCLILSIINMFSEFIFFKMFGVAFAFGCLNDYLTLMDCLREKLKLTDEESIMGIFLEENKGVEEIINILSETIAIDDIEEKVNLEDNCIRIMKVDDEYNIIDMQLEENRTEVNDNLVDKNKEKVRRLTRKK